MRIGAKVCLRVMTGAVPRLHPGAVDRPRWRRSAL